MNNFTNNQLTQPNSYSTIAKNNFPSKEYAIIINCLHDVPTEDHIYAIGDLIGPENITYAFKISKQRICIYLTKKELVDKLVIEHANIKLHNQCTEIRRYKSQQRLIISGGIPSIPNSLIEAELSNFGINLKSPINFIKAGLKDKRYIKVLSNRRQVFISDETDLSSIPPTTDIWYEDTKYRFFFSTDVTCFTCKNTGHTANECTNKNPNSNLTTTSEIENNSNQKDTADTPANNDNQNNKPKEQETKLPHIAPTIKNPTEPTIRTSTPTDIELTQNETTSNIYSSFHSEDLEQNKQNPKRHASSISSIEDSFRDTQNTSGEESTQNENFIKATKRKKKKSKAGKKESKLTIEDQIIPLKIQMKENPQVYTLTYETLIEFLEDVDGGNNQLQAARQYTDDITGLIFTLQDLHDKSPQRALKHRLTKLIKNIGEQYRKELQNQSDSQITEKSSQEIQNGPDTVEL